MFILLFIWRLQACFQLSEIQEILTGDWCLSQGLCCWVYRHHATVQFENDELKCFQKISAYQVLLCAPSGPVRAPWLPPDPDRGPGARSVCPETLNHQAAGSGDLTPWQAKQGSQGSLMHNEFQNNILKSALSLHYLYNLFHKMCHIHTSSSST